MLWLDLALATIRRLPAEAVRHERECSETASILMRTT